MASVREAAMISEGARLVGEKVEPERSKCASPPVSLLWLNFNSAGMLPLIRDSLQSVLSQDYPDFEAILVDNASTDGSWEAVARFMGGQRGKLPEGSIRLARTGKNLGYTGGFDFAYQLRRRDSKYVAVVSDDVILEPCYLRSLVGAMESDPSIGAIQGIVSTLDGLRVDSAGVIVDRFLIPHHMMRGMPVPHGGGLSKVSFVEGTCPIYRVEALHRILHGNLFYPTGFFQYLEDNMNGMLLWNSGYSCATLGHVVARHKREAGGGGLLRTYCLWRNRTALVRLTDSRLKPLEYAFGGASMLYLLSSGQVDKARMLIKGMWDGHGLAKRMKREHGFRISLSKVPMYRLGLDYATQLLSKSRGRGRLDEMDL